MTDISLRNLKTQAEEISERAQSLRLRTEAVLQDLKGLKTPENHKKKHHGRTVRRLR
jgi:hypothetical protein